MTRRQSILILLLTGVVTAFLAYRAFHPEEPSWHGKGLSQWLAELDRDHDAEAVEAIQRIGTNSLPVLLEMLQAKDSLFATKLMELNSKQSIVRFPVKRAYDRRTLAAAGLAILGPAAKPAVPALSQALNGKEPFLPAAYALAHIGPAAIGPLAEALTNRDSRVRQFTTSSLGWAGASNQAAISLLVATLKATDANTRAVAARSLAQIGPVASNSIPALIEAAADASDPVRWASIRALGDFGERASAAVPILLQASINGNQRVRREAGAALKKINPAAAAMAGATIEPSDPARWRR